MSDKICVLIIDDDDEVRTAVRRSLHMPGCTVHEACDGPEGLKLLADVEVDAVVSDFNMPGPNGLEVLAEVRELQPAALRVLLTGNADVHLAVRALNDGAIHRFLLKPWDHFDLRNILRTSIRTMRAAG